MTPENYWLQIHGLTINDKIEKIYDVLVSNYCYCLMSPKKPSQNYLITYSFQVCPLCLYHTQELRYYFSHLQVHKLKIFKCQCMPSSSPGIYILGTNLRN